MLPNYYLSVKFVCPGWRIPHLTLISSVEMNTEMQLYPRGKVKCFKPAMQFFHLPKSFSVISVKLSPYIFQKLKHVFVLLNNSCAHYPCLSIQYKTVSWWDPILQRLILLIFRLVTVRELNLFQFPLWNWTAIPR